MRKYTTISRAILEHLTESGEMLFDALFPNLSETRFLPSTYPRRRHTPKPHGELHKPSLSSILWRLKKEGLVANRGPRKKTYWRITPKGRMRLKWLPAQRQIYPKISLVLPPDGIVRLVSFDVPEKERAKRRWLRRELISCGYTPLHKSVLVGNRPLPEDLIEKMDFLRLNRYVHIAAVGKRGTITEQTLK